MADRSLPADHSDGIFSDNADPWSFEASVTISEVAYYWSDADLARAGEWLKSGLAPGGDLLLVHWTGETDYPQTADDAVSKLSSALKGYVEVKRTEREPQYRLDLWRARP